MKIYEYTYVHHKHNPHENVHLLGHAWDSQLGGAAFDLRLAEYLADQVNEQFKLTEKNLDIRKIPRPFAKLRAQSKKTKIVLSANENIPVVMQSLYDDRDFKTSVSRKKFEELTADLAQRCLDPVRTLLEELELTPTDLSLVEIIGGGVRMPKVKSMLKQYFDQDLGVHLNGDEAMALGAAFRAANLSTAFRVRSIGMNDIQPYGIGLRLSDTSDWVKKAALFKRSSRLGAKKVVSFVHEQDFDLVLRYDDEALGLLATGARRVLGHYQISGLTEFAAQMKERELGVPKVTLTFVLNESGTVSIAKVEALVEEVPPPAPVEEEEDAMDEKSEANSEAKENSEENATSEEKSTSEEDPKSEEAETSKEEQDKPPKKAKKKKPLAPKPIQHRRVLSVGLKTDGERKEDVSILPMSILEKKDSMEMLKQMQARDDLRRETAMAKNELESFVYAARDSIASNKAECVAAEVISESDVDTLTKDVNETEDWLYDEGENAEIEEYQMKLRTMKKTLDGMLYRLAEVSNRPAAVKRVESYQASVKELVTEWPTTKPHLTEDDFAEVTKRTETLVNWTSDRMADQAKLALTDEPAFASSEILRKLKTLKRFVNSVKDRKPPAPKPTMSKNETEIVVDASVNATEGEGETDKATEGEAQEPSKEEL